MLVTFPLLSIQDICSQLKSIFGCTYLKEENLQNPKPEVLKPIYIKLLTAIDPSVEPEHFKLSEEDRLASRYPECIEPLVCTYRLYQKLSDLSRSIVLRDAKVSLKDLTFPEQKKTRLIISSLLNALKFLYEFKNNELAKHEIYSKEKNSNFELEELEITFKSLQLEVAHLKDLIEERKTEFDVKEKEVIEVENEKNKSIEDKDKLLSVVKELEGKVERLEGEHSEIELKRMKVKESVDRSRELVVSDSEVVFNEKGEKERRLAELRSKANAEKIEEKNVSSHHKYLNQCIQHAKRSINLLSDPERLLLELSNNESLRNSYREEEIKVIERTKNHQKTLATNHHEFDQQFKTIQVENDLLESKVQSIKVAVINSQNRLDSLKNEILEQESANKALEGKKKEHEIAIEELKSNFEALKEMKELEISTIENLRLNYAKLYEDEIKKCIDRQRALISHRRMRKFD